MLCFPAAQYRAVSALSIGRTRVEKIFHRANCPVAVSSSPYRGSAICHAVMSGFSCFPHAPSLITRSVEVDCAFPRFGPINRLSICNEHFHHMQRSISPFFSFATGAQLSATDFFTRLRRIYNFAEVRFVKRVPCFLPFRSGKNRSEQFLPYTLPCIAVFAVPSPQSADVAQPHMPWLQSCVLQGAFLSQGGSWWRFSAGCLPRHTNTANGSPQNSGSVEFRSPASFFLMRIGKLAEKSCM